MLRPTTCSALNLALNVCHMHTISSTFSHLNPNTQYFLDQCTQDTLFSASKHFLFHRIHWFFFSSSFYALFDIRQLIFAHTRTLIFHSPFIEFISVNYFAIPFYSTACSIFNPFDFKCHSFILSFIHRIIQINERKCTQFYHFYCLRSFCFRLNTFSKVESFGCFCLLIIALLFWYQCKCSSIFGHSLWNCDSKSVTLK